MFKFGGSKKKKPGKLVPSIPSDLSESGDVKDCKSYLFGSNIDNSYHEDLSYVKAFMNVKGDFKPVIEDTTNNNSNYIYLSGSVKKCKDFNSFEKSIEEELDEEIEVVRPKKKNKLNIKVT